MKKLLLLLSILGLLVIVCFIAPWHIAKITIKVVGNDGKPLGGLHVEAYFDGHEAIEGETDTNGLFVLEGMASSGVADWRIENKGYYAREAEYEFSDGSGHILKPWNPVVTAVVRQAHINIDEPVIIDSVNKQRAMK